MRCPLLVVALVVAPMLAHAAGSALPGRWQGVVQIPGRPVAVTLDLGTDATGQWQGSITAPALGLAGAPLKELAVSTGRVTFALSGAFDGSRYGTARVDVAIDQHATLAGSFMQGGHSASLSLQRSGEAQVQTGARSTPVRAALEGEWVGQYEMGGYPRNVTIAFRNVAAKGATATFVIVGKQNTELPVDLVVEDGEFVRVESRAYGVTYEAKIGVGASELTGTAMLGAVEVPLVMRRSARSNR